MRKLSVALAFVLTIAALWLLAVGVGAEAPQDWQFAAMQCSGLSVADVQSGFAKFDSWYGDQYNLSTPAAWVGSYEARVNLFAHWVGCPDLLRDGKLTFAAKIYVPAWSYLFGNAPMPE